MELEARQTRHGWEPSMLLRFVKSCLRGEAASWWVGCILSYGDDQDQGPAEEYAVFRVEFKKHYGISGVTNDLSGAENVITRTSPQGDRDKVEVAQMPEAAQGGQRSQNSQVLSLTHTSTDLLGNMADETENQVPNIPNLIETIHETVVHVREQFRRTESERARMASASAQGAIPCGMVGDPRGAAGVAVGWGGGVGWRRRTSKYTGRRKWYHPGRPARGPGRGREDRNEGPQS
jgi:hypothetical protein